MKILIILLSSILFMLTTLVNCQFAMSQELLNASCIIEGTNGSFLPYHAAVEILNEESVPITEKVYTDQKGRVTFKNIKSGTYHLYCIWSDVNANIYEGFNSIVIVDHCKDEVILKMKD